MKKETVERTVVVKEEAYMLPLSKNEVLFLIDLLSSIEGSYTESVRKYAVSILNNILNTPDFASMDIFHKGIEERFRKLAITTLEGGDYQ